MFEAHLGYAETTFSNNKADESCVTFNTTACCWHSIYQCNVRYWITPGKRQSQPLWFIYIEFKNTDNSHDYKRIELIPSETVSTESGAFSANTLSLKQAQKIISTSQLGSNIDRLKTEQWCQSV